MYGRVLNDVWAFHNNDRSSHEYLEPLGTYNFHALLNYPPLFYSHKVPHSTGLFQAKQSCLKLIKVGPRGGSIEGGSWETYELWILKSFQAGASSNTHIWTESLPKGSQPRPIRPNSTQ